MISQPPCSRGSSSPSHGTRVEALRPAWLSCMQTFARLWVCTKETMRRQASICASVYRPVQWGVMRPSGETSVISVKSSPAPPTASPPRCTRCQSSGMPSVAEYWHMGETTTRLATSIPRSRKGRNMGGGGGSMDTSYRPSRAVFSAYQRVVSAMYSGSRMPRFS